MHDACKLSWNIEHVSCLVVCLTGSVEAALTRDGADGKGRVVLDVRVGDGRQVEHGADHGHLQVIGRLARRLDHFFNL